MSGKRHAPAALLTGKTRYPLYRRLGGPQRPSGQVQKISPPPGFDPRIIQPVASRYNYWAIPTPTDKQGAKYIRVTLLFFTLQKSQTHFPRITSGREWNEFGWKKYFSVNPFSKVGKGKAVLLEAWSGPEGSRKLRFPHFMTRTQDGNKIVSLTHRPPLPPGNTPGTHFC